MVSLFFNNMEDDDSEEDIESMKYRLDPRLMAQPEENEDDLEENKIVYCTSCGNTVLDTDLYCKKCGSKQHE